MNIARYRELMGESDRLLAESKRLYREAEELAVELVVELGLPPAPQPASPVGRLSVPPRPQFKRGRWYASVFQELHRYPEHGVAVGQALQMFQGQFDGWIILELSEERD